jgi:hypothetical protein
VRLRRERHEIKTNFYVETTSKTGKEMKNNNKLGIEKTSYVM